MENATIAVIMGSQSDAPTMQHAVDILAELKIPTSVNIVSAHRTPMRMVEFAKNAADNNIKVIIAGAGGAAHLAGMVASLTHIPVLGVPVASKHLSGQDSLLSIVQMPGGVPVGTLAIGDSGAKNAGLLAARIIALSDTEVAKRLMAWQQAQTDNVPNEVS